MRIPSSASTEVQQAFRELWAAIDRLDNLGARNVDLRGRRFLNAGDAIEPTDFVTKRQQDAQAAAASAQDAVFETVTVRSRARVLGVLQLPQKSDGSKHHVILFVNGDGTLDGVNDGAFELGYNDVDGWLELGYGMRIKWMAGLSSLGCPADGVLNVLNAALTGFARFVLGLDNATGIALTKNGTTLEIRLGGAGGALTDLTVHNLTAANIPASGGNAAFASVVIGVDPGGGDLLRVGGGATFTAQVTVNADIGAQRIGGTAFIVNGHAGVDFGPGAITSITIEKGIVTAAS